MRGLRAPGVHFFSAARGAASGAYDRAVDAPEFRVDFADVHMRGDQATQDFLKCAVGSPLIEQVPHGLPGPQRFGQITPGRTGPQNPENGMHGAPRVRPRATGGGRRREHVGNQVPLIVGQSMPWHTTSSVWRLIPYR